MTENMAIFVEANKKSHVYEGVWVNVDGSECRTLKELEKSFGILYRLKGCANPFILSKEDLKSAPGFSPDWGF